MPHEVPRSRGDLWHLNRTREFPGRDLLAFNILAIHTRGHGWDLGDFLAKWGADQEGTS